VGVGTGAVEDSAASSVVDIDAGVSGRCGVFAADVGSDVVRGPQAAKNKAAVIKPERTRERLEFMLPL
jgi:hypothetical protein